MVSLWSIAKHTTSQLTTWVVHDDVDVPVFSLSAKIRGGGEVDKSFYGPLQAANAKSFPYSLTLLSPYKSKLLYPVKCAFKKLNLLIKKKFMEAAKKLDAEINHYLMLLTDRQKEAVLTVIKTFAEESDTSGYDSELKQELERRYTEYSNGGELISEAEAKERIKAIINDKVEE